MTDQSFDAETLAFYDREAIAYAGRPKQRSVQRLTPFMDRLPPGGRVLELGCGGGEDASEMLALGFEVVPTDGSPAMAAQAERRLGRPVRIMRFEELTEADAYDGVWANASLLHTPTEALIDIMSRIHRALRPHGMFFASYKLGDGPARDALGRYYNFPTEADLRSSYAASGRWATMEMSVEDGGGYDGVARRWLYCLAERD